jgi:hypothetical protein
VRESEIETKLSIFAAPESDVIPALITPSLTDNKLIKAADADEEKVVPPMTAESEIDRKPPRSESRVDKELLRITSSAHAVRPTLRKDGVVMFPLEVRP